MHPIAIRYFLGEARKQLDERLGQIRHKLLAVSRRVDGYATREPLINAFRGRRWTAAEH